eukprot:1465340-Rhodomonas_salina.1
MSGTRIGYGSTAPGSHHGLPARLALAYAAMRSRYWASVCCYAAYAPWSRRAWPAGTSCAQCPASQAAACSAGSSSAYACHHTIAQHSTIRSHSIAPYARSVLRSA